MASIYDFKALTSRGKEIDFSQFKGKVLLIVNTASKCGFTPQFAGLEELNQKYKDRGLVIIGFPCNQFKEQDPGTDGQIEEFCQLNYGVTFQIMKKTDVNGPAAEPIFEYLKAQAPTEEYHGLKAKGIAKLFKTISKSVEKDSDIKWNFTKFLISKDGETVKRYAPTTEPKDFEQDVEAMLAQFAAMHAELQLDNQICFRLYSAARLVSQAYTLIPAGMGERLAACQLKLEG